jgi:hypothetical protein
VERQKRDRPAEPPLDVALRLVPGAIGNQIRHAVKHGGGQKFDLVMEHAMSHQERKDEMSLSQDERTLFDGLNSAGFFSFGQKRVFEAFEPQMRHLLSMRGLLPASEHEGFFSPEGQGRRLLAQVNAAHKIGRPTIEDGRSGFVADYLRRIETIMRFVPQDERLRFVSDDIPRALSESQDYASFLGNTMPFVDRYVRGETGKTE